MDNKKNIVCHLTSVHPPFDIRIFHKECKSLVNAGYTVFLIAPVKESLEKEGVWVQPIHLPKSRLPRMLVVTFKMWKKALSVKATIYHFHDPELMFCGILLRLSGKKVVFDVHENVRLSLESKDWLPFFIVPVLRVCYYIFERFALLFYSKLILAEESYLKYYPQKKCVVVLNYPLPSGSILVKKDPGSPFRLVYSGVVHPVRGIWDMLELVKRLNQHGIGVSLDLVGEVRPSNLHKELAEFIEKQGLSSKICIYGKVDFNEVKSFLAVADIGLALLKPIPNYRESLPTKIFEYMQHGLPVVTNDFPLYKKYVEEPNTGICVNINDMGQVVEKVAQLLKSPEKLRKMSENGIRVIENHYNWKSQEKKLIELYSKL